MRSTTSGRARVQDAVVCRGYGRVQTYMYRITQSKSCERRRHINKTIKEVMRWTSSALESRWAYLLVCDEQGVFAIGVVLLKQWLAFTDCNDIFMVPSAARLRGKS